MTAPATKSGEREARRRERAEAIRDGALVRQAVSQSAAHECVGGVHIVTWQGKRFSGRTLDEAIEAAKEGEL